MLAFRAMDLVRLLGENVRAARKRQNMSQEELALEADMKRSYLSELERGKRNPSVRALGRLATALQMSPPELLREPFIRAE
jgi:transcriptional regulator with XRE-family HTH domain